jgi:hypothetical protein
MTRSLQLKPMVERASKVYVSATLGFTQLYVEVSKAEGQRIAERLDGDGEWCYASFAQEGEKETDILFIG